MNRSQQLPAGLGMGLSRYAARTNVIRVNRRISSGNCIGYECSPADLPHDLAIRFELVQGAPEGVSGNAEGLLELTLGGNLYSCAPSATGYVLFNQLQDGGNLAARLGANIGSCHLVNLILLSQSRTIGPT